jgi:parallel beta-helix repeat protein
MLNATTSGQQINLSGLLKNMKWWQATIMICSILLASGYAASQGVNVSINVDLQGRVQAIENRLDIPVNSTLSAFLKSNTYMVSLVDTYATLMNGSNAHLIEFLTNHSQVIMDGLSNASVNGGSVYVAAGAYSASVVVPNNTRLVIENGATGITYTVNASATCIVDNFNSFDSQYYSSGSLVADFNMNTGNLLLQSENLTTLFVSGAAIANSFNSTTYYVGSINVTGNMLTGGGGNTTWQGSWNSTVAQLITNSVIAWSQISSANLTVQQLISLYQNFAWQSSWNSTVSDILLNAAVSWSQITNANATVNQLIAASTLSWSQINSANATVQQLINLYQSFAWQSTWNSTVVQLASNLTNLYASGWVNSTSIEASGFYWNLENRTDVIANPIHYGKYVTYGDGTNYQIQNCTSGQFIYQSTNGSNTINFAFGNLTIGRTWKEPVIVLGNYTTDVSISIPSQSQALLYCYIRKAASNNYSIIDLNTVSDVEIDGGTLDGNRANQSPPGTGSLLQEINITNCQRVTVSGVTGLNAGNSFIWMGGSSGCIISRNYINNTYNDGISLSTSSHSNTIAENELWYCGHVPIVLYGCYDNTITANVGAYFGWRVSFAGIYVFGNSYRNTISVNVMEYGNGSGGHGIAIEGSSYGNTISDNSCINNTSAYGIYLAPAYGNTVSGNTCAGNSRGICSDLAGSYNNQISGNIVSQNTYGIVIGISYNDSVIGNKIYANTNYGIWILTSTVNQTTWVEGNDIIGNGGTGVRLEPGNFTLMKDNKITYNGGWGIYIVAAASYNNTIWSNDMGWNVSGDISNNGTNTVAFDNFELATRTWVASINPPTSGR